jgi:hypothetical protein
VRRFRRFRPSLIATLRLRVCSSGCEKLPERVGQSHRRSTTPAPNSLRSTRTLSSDTALALREQLAQAGVPCPNTKAEIRSCPETFP